MTVQNTWLKAGMCLLLTFGTAACAQPSKKLIEIGWDVPEVMSLPGALPAMQQLPFDGIVCRLDKAHRRLFDPTPWNPADLQPQIDALASLQWGTFTDNFLIFNVANPGGVDWFNDAQWDTVVANLRLINQAVVAGHLKGVAIDPEPYGPNLWLYSGETAKRPFQQVSNKVRSRGVQVMTALQEGLPNFRVFSLFALSIMRDYGRVPDNEFPAKLQANQYALLPAFVNGMIDAAGATTKLIDGNETAYYYRNSATFGEGHERISNKLMQMYDRSDWNKYRSTISAGNAIWVDLLANLSTKPVFTRFLSERERAQLLEHNVYWAMRTSDEYAWLYSEHLDWWGLPLPVGDTSDQSWRHTVSADLVAAVRDGRALAKRGAALPFTVDANVTRATRAEATEQQRH